MTAKLSYKPEQLKSARELNLWNDDKVMDVVKDFTYACTLNEELEKAHSGISDWAWDELKKQKLIQDIDMGNGVVITRPTQLGSKVMGELTGHKPYKSNSEAYIHNGELLYKIWERSDEDQDSYRTEADLKSEAKERGIKFNDSISCCDGAFVNSAGVYTFIEIITDNYSPEEIAAKELFVETWGEGANYEPYKI